MIEMHNVDYFQPIPITDNYLLHMSDADNFTFLYLRKIFFFTGGHGCPNFFSWTAKTVFVLHCFVKKQSGSRIPRDFLHKITA